MKDKQYSEAINKNFTELKKTYIQKITMNPKQVKKKKSILRYIKANYRTLKTKKRS